MREGFALALTSFVCVVFGTGGVYSLVRTSLSLDNKNMCRLMVSLWQNIFLR